MSSFFSSLSYPCPQLIPLSNWLPHVDDRKWPVGLTKLPSTLLPLLFTAVVVSTSLWVLRTPRNIASQPSSKLEEGTERSRLWKTDFEFSLAVSGVEYYTDISNFYQAWSLPASKKHKLWVAKLNVPLAFIAKGLCSWQCNPLKLQLILLKQLGMP